MLDISLDFTPAMIGQAWDDLITHEMLWSCVRCFDHAWDDLITYEMLWSRMRWFDHVWDALITHEMIWSRGYVPRSVLLSWFYNFGPFSDFFKMSVYVEVLITLDWSHNHFFRYLSPGVSLFRLKISFHQAFCSFFWHFLFF